MKRINNIVVSNTEPSVNSLWITNNTIKWFGKSGWEGLDFTDNTKLWNAINQEISDRQEEDDYIKKNALKNSQIRMRGFSRDDEYWIRYTCTNTTISSHSSGLDQNLVINTASSTENGMMSFSDKAKLDSIDATTLVNTVDGLIPAAYLPSYVDDVLEYSSVDTFPETGEAGKIYVDTTTNLTYRWTGTQYIEISKSIGLGETAADAYPGDKGKQNADNIATLQTQVGSNNFSSSNYLSKETNVTEALLQLDEEIKATNDNLDLEHANAEATYAKKTDLSDYLPLSGGTMTLTPDDIRESNHISFNIKNYDVPHIELTGKGIDEAACLIAEAGRVEVCGYLPEEPGYRHWAQLDRDGVHLYNEYFTPGSATFTRSGVTIDGKTTSDLLNAAGGTTVLKTIGGESLLGTGNIETIGKLYPDSTHGEIFNEYSRNVASGDFSHAEGAGTNASGEYSHAEGTGTTAQAIAAHAEGAATKAIGDQSHAEGVQTSAEKQAAHAEGADSHATGQAAHAEGQEVTASGDYSHAEGSATQATGPGSHAEGGGTTASGQNSHSEGGGTNANGASSHAEGGGTTATGNYSHAEGLYTTANNGCEHAEGQWNLSNTGSTDASRTIHSVGIGTGSTTHRRNAHEIMLNGDHYIYGIGNYDGTNYSAAKTLQQVINTIQGSTTSISSIIENLATKNEVDQAISEAEFNNGHNAVSSVTDIPVSKRLAIVTISNNDSFTLASTPADGREIHVIVHNTSSSDIEITMPSSSGYVKMSGDTLTVAGNSYADINVISDGTNMYIRAL